MHHIFLMLFSNSVCYACDFLTIGELCMVRDVCDMIKGNESDVANIDFEL